MSDLKQINYEIGKCIKCSDFIEIRKSKYLDRGSESDFIVIGLSPGQNEIISAEPFSGPAGTKLIKWLIKANLGKDENEVRSRVYFTSLVKCNCETSNLPRLFRNCESFLERQIKLVNPKIAILLGSGVFNIAFDTHYTNDYLVGKSFSFSEINNYPLIPELSTFYGVSSIITLPHPSGLSHWLNTYSNKKKLIEALHLIKNHTP